MSHDPERPESEDELDPDEPKTPMWLPLVGLGLFLAGLTYVLMGSEEKPSGDAAGEAAPSAEAPAEE